MVDLIKGKYCYWVDRCAPDASGERFRVSVVIENESGHRPTGGEGVMDPMPWYWDSETCDRMNRERLGLDRDRVNEIIASSMWAKS